MPATALKSRMLEATVAMRQPAGGPRRSPGRLGSPGSSLSSPKVPISGF
jgi:hypothetical protein